MAHLVVVSVAGMTSHAFNWSLYLQVSKSVAAPESLFKVGTAEVSVHR